MTNAEKWRTVSRVLLSVAPGGILIGLILGYALGGGEPRSIVAGGVIGLLTAAGMVTFEVSWAVGRT